MPRKGFPEIASMPTFRINDGAGPSNRYAEDIPMRTIDTNDINSLPPCSSPYAHQLNNPIQRQWTPISISSGSSDENEKLDTVDNSVKGEAIK